MKKSSVVKIMESMMLGTEKRQESVEVNSRQDFYYQGSYDALKTTLEMVKRIDCENRLLDGIGTDDV